MNWDMLWGLCPVGHDITTTETNNSKAVEFSLKAGLT
jgi:hypothetical protein